MVTIGIDTHKATLAVSAIDGTGRETGARTFPNDRQGHVGLLRWAQAHGSERRFGIEGSGSFGAALARLLVAAGEAVVEVPAILTERERRSDPTAVVRVFRAGLTATDGHSGVSKSSADSSTARTKPDQRSATDPEVKRRSGTAPARQARLLISAHWKVRPTRRSRGPARGTGSGFGRRCGSPPKRIATR